MLTDPAVVGSVGFLCVFAVIMVGGWVFLWTFGGQRRIASRLRELAGESAEDTSSQNTGSSMWRFSCWCGSPFTRSNDKQVENLRTRLRHAGYFHPLGTASFLVVQLVTTILLAMATGFAVWAVLRCPILQASYWGAAGAAVGYLIPGLWLSVAGQKRRRILRKGMPDALDLLVLCMDGGLSLNAAMQMVIEELDAHPELSTELGIVHREIQMGLPTGQALRKFADRCDLADVRDLASIILQAEKLGASISQTLRNFADSYRLERHQKAEETAQKAAVKVLFPTLLCIFPAMFIVLMGPAAFQLTKLFHR